MTVTFTVWSGGELIGHTSLERSGVGPGIRTGAFHPTTAFDAVWPVLRTFHALAAETTAGFQAIPAGASGEEIHAWLVAQPTAAEFAASGQAVAALRLEVRDQAGVGMAGVRVLISESVPPTLVAQIAELDPEQAPELVRLATADWPKYLVTVVPERTDRSASGG